MMRATEARIMALFRRSKFSSGDNLRRKSLHALLLAITALLLGG
jgi:hypothetical protein